MAVMARKAVVMEIIVKTLGGSIRLRFDFPLDPSNAPSPRLWLLQRIAIRPAPLTAVLAAGRTGCQRDDRVRVQGRNARKDGSAASHLQGLRRCEIFFHAAAAWLCVAAADAAAVTLRDILRAYFVVCKPHMFVIRVQQKHMKVGVSPSKPLSLCLASAATYSSPSTSRREHGLHGDAPRAACDTKRDQPIAGGSREKVMGTR
jgi:hypothetical protein